MFTEEYAYIIDNLPQGVSNGKFSRGEPVCYAVGESEFKLFELIPKKGAIINFEDRVYIGKDPSKRDVIDHVKRRMGANGLTSNAVAELEYAVTMIVKSDETRYISFFNNAGPVTMKKHLLEELPGLGKKSMQAILSKRNEGPFKSFADISKRVPTVKNPEKLIVNRIVLEITDPHRKRYLFVTR